MKHEKQDRRNRRTRQMISDALVALILEKRYDAITVQDIIDRADVDRSTFHKHFYDKDNLLLCDIETVFAELFQHLEHSNTEPGMLFSTHALFSHIDKYRTVYDALRRGKNIDMVIEAGQKYLARGIEHSLQQKNLDASIPASAVAQYLAGSFLTFVRWWLDCEMPYTAAQIEDMFQALVRPGLEQVIRKE